MRVLLKVYVGPSFFYRVCGEDEADVARLEYEAVGIDVKVVGESIEAELEEAIKTK